MGEKKPAKKGAQKSASKGFTAEEKATMRERVRELKASEGKAEEHSTPTTSRPSRTSFSDPCPTRRSEQPMRANRSIPSVELIPELSYADVAAAAKWLCAAFGFQERLIIGDHRVQLLAGTGAIVVMDQSRESPAGSPPSGHGVLVRVENVDAHCARAIAAGAELVSPPTTFPFGERQYSVRDLGGHRWTFSETISDVDPASWGGSLRVQGSKDQSADADQEGGRRGH